MTHFVFVLFFSQLLTCLLLFSYVAAVVMPFSPLSVMFLSVYLSAPVFGLST